MPYTPVAQRTGFISIAAKRTGYIPVAQRETAAPEIPELSISPIQPTSISTPAFLPGPGGLTDFLNVAKVVGQGIARQYAATAAKISKGFGTISSETVDPKTFFGVSPASQKIGVAVFGRDTPFSATTEDQEILEIFGIDPKVTEEVSGGKLTFLLTALDLTGIGKAKGLLGLTRTLKVSKDIAETSKALRTVGFTEDVIADYAPLFVKETTSKGTKKLLDAAVNLQAKTKGQYIPVAARTRAEVVGVAPRVAGKVEAPKIAPETPKIALDLQPLAQEARETITLYRAAPKFPSDKFGKGTYFADSEQSARFYSESHYKGDPSDIKVERFTLPKGTVFREPSTGNYILKGEAPVQRVTPEGLPKIEGGIPGRRGLKAVGLAPEAPRKIIRTETQLLKTRIRAESRLAKAVEEVREITRKTAETLKNKAKRIEEIKSEITNYAKTKLSVELRGKILSAVNSAKTRGDVAAAVRRINIERNNEIKKEIAANIEDIMGKIDALPPNQQKKAVEALEGLTAETFSKKTQAKLTELKEFISKEPEAVFRFGAKTIKKAERAAELGKKPLGDEAIRNLIEINDRLDFLMQEGKLVEKTTEEIKGLRVDNALKEITESAPRNLDEGLPPPRKPGELVPTASFSGAKDSTIEAMRKGTQYYVTPDVGFQILDNEKQFGANWRIFKRPMDVAQDLENGMRNEIIDNLFRRLDDIEIRHGKLNTENYENTMLYATLQQQGGRAKLQKSDPRLFTDAFLDGIKLSEGEMEFYKLGREIFDELRPHIEDVLWKTRGEKLGKVNNYWSWITDFDNSDELFLRLSGDYKLASRTEQGFTKTRTLVGTQKINFNALDVLVKHINDSATFIAKEELLNHLSKISRSDKYAQSVGKMGQKWVAGWLDLLARGGVPKGYKPGPLTRLVRNVGHGVLGFRVSPIVKQPLAKIVSVGFLGVDSFKYDPQFFTDFVIRDSIHKISKQQAFRNFDDPSYIALAKAKRLAKWQKWGYSGIKTFDSWTADSVWYAAYRHNLNKRNLDFSFSLEEFKTGKNIDNEAKEYADLIVRRTQGSSEYKDAPLMYASQSNKDLTMAILQFQRFIHNQSILWRDAKVALIKEKDPIKAAAIASSLIAAGIAESYITTGMAQIFSSESYAEKEREKSIGKRVFNSVTGQIPVISNLTSIAEYGGSGVPVWDVFRQGYQGAISAATAKKTETKVKGAIKAGETAAALGGISGAGQAGQILRKFVGEPEKVEPRTKQLKTPPGLPELPTLKKSLPTLPGLPKLP